MSLILVDTSELLTATDIDIDGGEKTTVNYDDILSATLAIIPDNPTNGDMIKALFPNNPYTQLIHDMALYADKSRQKIIAEFPMAWWNAPYKRGERMTKEEAKKYLIKISYMLGNMSVEFLSERDGDKMREAIETLWQEPCEDCISRQAVKEQMIKYGFHAPDMTVTEFIEALPPVTPQPKTGHWLRMSDLSEQEDDRYKCSRCGNVVHYKDGMNLYTFNSWCGRCGSDNGRHINYEAEGMTIEEINAMKYKVCCPMCDNEKCVRGTDSCEAEQWAQWAKSKAESEEERQESKEELQWFDIA